MINRIGPYFLSQREPGYSLFTVLGIVSGEVLTLLEQQGMMSLRSLIRELPHPALLVTMAVGALVREGLVNAEQHELEVLLAPRREWQIPKEPVKTDAPEVWGG